MDKKTGIVIIVIGVVILALIGLAFGLDKKAVKLTSEDVLRINDNVYKKEEFEKFIMYTLYKNKGELAFDKTEYAEEIKNGLSTESIFISDTLNSFYQMKVFELMAEDKNIVLSGETLEEINEEFTTNEEKILASGLTKEEFISIGKQQAIMNLIVNNPTEYIELPDEVYNEYLSHFSGDDLKSYTYRMLQVSYTPDTVSGDASGDVSGEVIPGNREEKEAYMNAIVARLEAGESFEKVAESGDNRIIMNGTNLEFAKSIQEYATGFLLSQKMGSEELAEAAKKTTSGSLTEVVDTGDVFQIALIENVEDGVVGKAKEELIELMIAQYASDLIYQDIKDMEVNNAAVSRIQIK